MYNLKSERFPPKMRKITFTFANMVSGQVEQARIPQVRRLILLPPTDWRRKPTYMKLYVVANVRRPYTLVEKLSRILAPVYMEMLVLPDVHVISIEQWKSYKEAGAKIWRELKKRGLVVYEQREESR